MLCVIEQLYRVVYGRYASVYNGCVSPEPYQDELEPHRTHVDQKATQSVKAGET